MMMDDDDNDAGRLAEREDTGRVGSHPSTLASTKVCTKFFVIGIFYMLYVLHCSYLLTDFFFFPCILYIKKATEDEASEDYDPFKDSNGGSSLVNTRIADRESD